MTYRVKTILLYLTPLAIVIASLMIGSTQHLGLGELFNLLIDKISGDNQQAEISAIDTIVWQVRLPRVLLTFLVGAALACSGGVLQAIFRNPIVDPFILGISSGSAFGAALAMLVPILPINASAFTFGIIAVALTYGIAYSSCRSSIINVVLSGVIMSGVFTALLTLVQYISDPYKLQAIVQWTMGSLHTASWHKLNMAILPIVIGLTIIVLLRWKLNLLTLEDQEALAIGVNPKVLKIALVSAATMITAISVASVGVISLFGLIVPHISRMIFGSNNSIGVIANISIGGSLLLIIDDFSRAIMPFELPVGVFTMLIGAPIFIYLMKNSLTNWNK